MLIGCDDNAQVSQSSRYCATAIPNCPKATSQLLAGELIQRQSGSNHQNSLSPHNFLTVKNLKTEEKYFGEITVRKGKILKSGEDGKVPNDDLYIKKFSTEDFRRRTAS